ncbi:hypothetical protein [Conservatibacter flavescens]|nr:hypothetical protein [Conservatibacter flavescens]
MHPIIMMFGVVVACAGVFTGLLFWANWDIISGKKHPSSTNTDN